MRSLLRLLLVVVIVAHAAVIGANVAAIFCVWHHAPWPIALPIDTFLLGLLFTRVECPATNLENRLRRALGLREIKGFVGHYFIWPVRFQLRQLRRRRNLAEG